MSTGSDNRVMARVNNRSASGSTSLIRHLQILRTVTEAVSRSLDLNEVIQKSLAALTDVTGHEIASLHLVSVDGKTLLLRGERGLSDKLREINQMLPMGQGLIGRVAASGRVRRVDEAGRAPDLLPAARAAVSAEGIRGFVCVPIRARHRVLGTLSPVAWSGVSPLQACLEIADVLVAVGHPREIKGPVVVGLEGEDRVAIHRVVIGPDDARPGNVAVERGVGIGAGEP